jgi:hypothetical protein
MDDGECVVWARRDVFLLSARAACLGGRVARDSIGSGACGRTRRPCQQSPQPSRVVGSSGLTGKPVAHLTGRPMGLAAWKSQIGVSAGLGGLMATLSAPGPESVPRCGDPVRPVLGSVGSWVVARLFIQLLVLSLASCTPSLSPWVVAVYFTLYCVVQREH